MPSRSQKIQSGFTAESAPHPSGGVPPKAIAGKGAAHPPIHPRGEIAKAPHLLEGVAKAIDRIAPLPLIDSIHD